MKYYFARTRGPDSLTFASVSPVFNPMLEQFGHAEGDTPAAAYDKWADQNRVFAVCLNAKPIAGAKHESWQLSIFP